MKIESKLDMQSINSFKTYAQSRAFRDDYETHVEILVNIFVTRDPSLT
jgi:hypothetical protein